VKTCGFCSRKAHPGVGCWARAEQIKQGKTDAADERLRRTGGRAANESHVLYRFFDGVGDLLYVGITNRPTSRFKGHQRDADWFGDAVLATMEHFRDRVSLERAELKAIEEECPRYNRAHSSGRVLMPRVLPVGHKAARPRVGSRKVSRIDLQQVLDFG
jgi:hypothetical protein